MSLLVPKGTFETEYIVCRSRFIGRGVRVDTPEEARVEITRRREEYSDATHVVYAFAAGPESSRAMGMSDDGEPKGTAGRPVLEVVKGKGITNVLVTVVRYFGGTKLGTGGLVRAYTESARRTLAGLPLEPWVIEVEFTVGLPYPLYEPALKILEEHRGKRLDEEFDTLVRLTGSVPESDFTFFKEKITTLSRGEVDIVPCG
jgi:uncharacterized YigZ family protein